MMLGEHADISEVPKKYKDRPLYIPYKRRLRIPFELPNFVVNKSAVRHLMNYIIGKERKPRCQLVDLDSYFYPLDSILGWNKIYGLRGFVQYQCVVPLENAEQGLNELIELIANAGSGSFLAVLKDLALNKVIFHFQWKVILSR